MTTPVPPSRHGAPWGLLAATGLALGAALPLGKQAVAHGVGPLSFVLLPSLAAGGLLAVLAAWRHGRPAQPMQLVRFGLLAGLLGQALPNTLAAWLAAEAGASFSAIAFTLPPVATLALMLLCGFEAWQPRRVAAVLLGLAGALGLATARLVDGSLSVAGAVALLALPLSIGAGNVYRARHLPDGVAAEWLGASLSLGAAALIAPLWWLAPDPAAGLARAGLPYLAAQVALGTLAVLLFFRLQQRAEPVAMSFVGYAIALTGVALGALLLDEPLPWQLAPAAAVIGTGFWLVQRTPRPAAASSPAPLRP
jgi:drug/metabolite transporter (DMT)-like permease